MNLNLAFNFIYYINKMQQRQSDVQRRSDIQQQRCINQIKQNVNNKELTLKLIIELINNFFKPNTSITSIGHQISLFLIEKLNIDPYSIQITTSRSFNTIHFRLDTHMFTLKINTEH